MIRGKRGQTGNIAKVFMGILLVYLVAVALVTIFNINEGIGPAVEAGFTEVSDVVVNLGGPFLNFILNLENAGENAFLMVLAFILIAIIIVGTLDSVNIFGEPPQGEWINLIVGIIVSIIGVRYMPGDVWGSLTAPSSAFVATILVGIPFLAMFFVSMKIKHAVVRKFVWAFYLIMLIYLIVTGENGNGINYAYSAFGVAAILMMFMDRNIRRWMHFEFLGRRTVEHVQTETALRRVAQLSKEIEDMIKEKDGLPEKSKLRVPLEKAIEAKEKSLKKASMDANV